MRQLVIQRAQHFLHPTKQPHRLVVLVIRKLLVLVQIGKERLAIIRGHRLEQLTPIKVWIILGDSLLLDLPVALRVLPMLLH